MGLFAPRKPHRGPPWGGPMRGHGGKVGGPKAPAFPKENSLAELPSPSAGKGKPLVARIGLPEPDPREDGEFPLGPKSEASEKPLRRAHVPRGKA